MNKVLIIFLWLTCFTIVPSCVSFRKGKEYKAKIAVLEMENIVLKNSLQEKEKINDALNECLNSLKQYKFKLINCDNRLMDCFDSVKRVK